MAQAPWDTAAELTAIFKANADLPTLGLAAKRIKSPFWKPLVRLSNCEYLLLTPVIPPPAASAASIFLIASLNTSSDDLTSLSTLLLVILRIFFSAPSKISSTLLEPS